MIGCGPSSIRGQVLIKKDKSEKVLLLRVKRKEITPNLGKAPVNSGAFMIVFLNILTTKIGKDHVANKLTGN